MGKLIFIFLDGVGIGADDASNPFFAAKTSHLPFFQNGLRLPDGSPVKPISSAAGLPGIPQSATCQTSLFTGRRGKSLGERHLQGYPNQRLRRLILASNLFSRLEEVKASYRYLNAYPYHGDLFTREHLRIEPDGRLWFSPRFPAHWKRMISVTTCLLLASGQHPLQEADIIRGGALYQDYSNRTLIARGAKIPEFSPEEAAEVLARASEPYDFTLYEYFQTDACGHRANHGECRDLVSALDRLMARLLSCLDPRDDTLLLTSDHGNIEDLEHRGHTTNPVPLLAWGRHGNRLRQRIAAIEDVTPAVAGLFKKS